MYFLKATEMYKMVWHDDGIKSDAFSHGNNSAYKH